MPDDTLDLNCPACGAPASADALERLAAGGAVFACDECGHTWSASPDGLDPFSLIISTRATPVTPCPERRPLSGHTRARRYIVRLPVRYRMANQREWRLGLTENISKSGILFRMERSGALFGYEPPAEPDTPVEIMLEVPSAPLETSNRIRCDGHVVRTVPPEGPDRLPMMAAAVGEYQLASA